MAAWVARVESVASQGQDITISVSYYDATDTTFQTQLWSKQFVVDPEVVLADLRTQAVNAGQRARTVLARRDQLIAQLQGNTVNVP